MNTPRWVGLFVLMAGGLFAQTLPNGTYTVSNSAGNLVLDDPGWSKTVGTKVILWPSNSGANQQWLFTAIGNGYYTITNHTSSLVLDDPYRSQSSGTQLWQYSPNGTVAQHWLVAPVGSGYYTIKNQASGLMVDAAANTQNTAIIQASANGSQRQKWNPRKGAVSFSPSSLAFSSQAVGTNSTSQTATLSNTGTSTVSINSTTLSGANSGDFGYNSGCGSSLAGGTNCSIGVSFSPTVSGTRTATLEVFDNASGSPQTVSLSGVGGTASSHSARLNWTLSPTGDVTSQNVYRCAGLNCTPSTVVMSAGAASISVTDTGVVNGSDYDYYVTAVDPSGESLGSNTAPAAIPST